VTAPSSLPNLRRRLLSWYDGERRELPWRAAPGHAADPYRVWVSEVMLQQTRATVVKSYFERWMQVFPTLHTLAAADEEQVLGLWQGLGYYSRARRLREGARYVVREMGGVLCADPRRLLDVPGIGAYSAGAIASIAFGQEAPLVDGNVIRVLTRVFALSGDPGRAPLKARLWELSGQLVRGERPGDFNQALMDLGATVCTPRRPICGGCPWARSCQAHARGQSEMFPEMPKKRQKEELHLVSLLCVKKRGTLLEKAPADARWWAGLWTLPTRPLAPDQAPLAAAAALLADLGFAPRGLELGPPLRHAITRFRVLFHPVLAAEPTGPGRLGTGRRFASSADLSTLALPAPHRKLLLRAAGAKTSFAGDPPLE